MAEFYPRFKAALLPLIAVSTLCMMATGGYIAWAGMWQNVWMPVLVFFISPLVFPLLLIPAAMCGGMMRGAQQTAPRLAILFQTLSVACLVSVMAGWGAFVFHAAAPVLAAGGTIALIAPVWCVSAATAPWAVFARGDRDNVFFTMMVGMLCIGACIAAALRFDVKTGGWTWFLLIAAVMSTLAAIQAAYEERITARHD